jgi:5'-3' exonuclease
MEELNMSNTLYNILIFDVYNQYFRIYNRNESLSDIGGKKAPIEAIVNFFSLVNNYIEKFGTKDCKVFWLFDNAKSSVMKCRRDLDKDYKKNRKPQSEEFYRGLDLIELILKFYRDETYTFRKSGIEGDDFVQPILDNYVNEHDKVLMFSTDMDWARGLLRDDEHDIIVNQYIKNNEILTVKSFEEKYGFKPTVSNVIFWKTFNGDVSDCILPTLPNYPKQYFLDCIRRYSHVSHFINDVINGKITYLDAGWRIKIRNNAERMMLNWELISSMDIDSSELENWKVECAYKPNKLLIIYNTLNIVGRFDKRVKNENSGSDLLSMLNGETVERA